MGRNDTNIWESIKDLINIDEHIKFISNLINKYSWKKDDHEILMRHLSAINNKQKDKCINLSVVGEFSSGKSSFINALLGEELLVSSAIQGTTVVNTIIGYSEKIFINVFYKSNRLQHTEPNNRNELKRLLSDITTNSENAKNISWVVVGIPSVVLKNNIRIIDTPGTNSVESWHEDVTKRAINEISDLSVVLTDAIKPLPQSLMDFMEENLSSIYAQCAIVVTRSDLIREKDRQDVNRYIERKIQNELGVKGMLVIPFAAPALIGELTGKKLVENQLDMAKMSREGSRKLFIHTAGMRQVAQIKKLLLLIDSAFDLLSKNMSVIKSSCDAELKLLQRSRQAQLEPFIQQQKTNIIAQFVSQNRELRLVLENKCDDQISFAKRNIISSINNIEGNIVDSVKTYMEGKFFDECRKEALKISSLSVQMHPKQEGLFTMALKSFQSRFTNQFAKLGILKVEFDMNEIKAPTISSVNTADIQGAVNYISSELSNENWAFGGGALAGAAIGTAIAPGIGTGIGFLVGLFAGAAMSPNVEDVKKKVQSKVEAPLLSFLRKIKSDTLQSFDDSTDKIVKAIEIEIERYLKRYKCIINQRIIKNQEQQKVINSELEKINSDLKLIDTHKKQLQAALAKLK